MTVLATPEVDHDYRGGFEIRFGSTISTGNSCDSGCDSYGYGGYGYGSGNGCNSCATQDYAWEFGYWFLDDDVNSAQVVDGDPTDTNRIYGMKNFAGLMYNGRPVNDFYDYEVPVVDPTVVPPAIDVRVLAQRVRSNFQAQNLELNFLRLPLFDGGDVRQWLQCWWLRRRCRCAPACGSPFSITPLRPPIPAGGRRFRVCDHVGHR